MRGGKHAIVHTPLIEEDTSSGLVATGCTCGWSIGDQPSRRDAHEWFGRHLLVQRQRAPQGYDQPKVA